MGKKFCSLCKNNHGNFKWISPKGIILLNLRWIQFTNAINKGTNYASDLWNMGNASISN